MVDYLSEQLRDMAPHRAILRAVECKFMGRVHLVPPVLDIGCGDGHFASIAYAPIEIGSIGGLPIDVGIDVMERDLREAAARPEVYRRVMHASATRLPFDDAAFNTVVSNCVIEHVPDNEAVLREISRVLRPGGAFATNAPAIVPPAPTRFSTATCWPHMRLSRSPTRRATMSGASPAVNATT